MDINFWKNTLAHYDHAGDPNFSMEVVETLRQIEETDELCAVRMGITLSVGLDPESFGVDLADDVIIAEWLADAPIEDLREILEEYEPFLDNLDDGYHDAGDTELLWLCRELLPAACSVSTDEFARHAPTEYVRQRPQEVKQANKERKRRDDSLKSQRNQERDH